MLFGCHPQEFLFVQDHFEFYVAASWCRYVVGLALASDNVELHVLRYVFNIG